MHIRKKNNIFLGITCIYEKKAVLLQHKYDIVNLIVYIYFLLIRIAALFGHKKARKLVEGQKATLTKVREEEWTKVQGAIWIHAASVGEFEQARPIIERIKEENERTKIVVTFFSPSGFEARQNYELADGVYYLPFATRGNAKRFIKALQPKMAIFVKYEFWPAYIRELKKQNIPTYSICSIFRPNQYFFRWWGKSQLNVLKRFTHLFVQDEASRQLLASHGVQNVTVAGDTRFDRVAAVKAKGEQVNGEKLTPIAQFVEGAGRVVVAGSTWEEDDRILAECINRMAEEQDIKLILVPHELNEKHLQYIFNLFQGQYVRYSAVSNRQLPAMSRRTILLHARVLVMDVMGLLSSTYRFGHVAYIGGGFGEGIHNTIEAAVYGMPVVFGPNYHHFREAQGLIDAGAGRSIKNAAELEKALNAALESHLELGARAAEYVESEKGATAKIYGQIFRDL